MSVPQEIRRHLRRRLWTVADGVGWDTLPPHAKAKLYESWTLDASIGGLLAHYIDKGQVRVYLKDTLLKGYTRNKYADSARPFRALGVPADSKISEVYVKPHGRRLADGRLICWGRAEEWKSILMAVHERTYIGGANCSAVVLLCSMGRFHETHARAVVEEASRRLGICQLVWLDL